MTAIAIPPTLAADDSPIIPPIGKILLAQGGGGGGGGSGGGAGGGAGLGPSAGPGPRGYNEREAIYGRQLMTRQERNQYREQMRKARTDEERQHLRLQHRERMQERARQRGVTISE